ncbi:uncharacterized protein [Argopecten irradians]|uniref:uncharacterized protein isoform X2 n=1 Tax=Argopecten irradians TaxID=31199 RepID=UPI00371707E8
MEAKRDIPAIKMMGEFSKEWGGMTISPTKTTLDEAKRFQSRLDDLLPRTIEGITEVKGYIGHVSDDITSISGQVKKSMADNAQIMSDLANMLVPTKRPPSSQGSKTSTEVRQTSAPLSEVTKRTESNKDYHWTKNTTRTQKSDNEEIAGPLEKSVILMKKQQEFDLFLENVLFVCEKAKSKEGLDNNDISALKADIEEFGKTLENEKERKERQRQREEEEVRQKKEKEEEEARQKKKREDDEAREKKRKENEIRRRNPDNWPSSVFKAKCEEDGFTPSDVLCVVYAMEGSFSSLQCTNMEGQIEMADWLDIPHEQQASCPIQISFEGYVNLELPMEVYVPYSINGTKHEPEIKVSIDNGTWQTLELVTKREVPAFPTDINYVGTTITRCKSFRLVVAAVPKRKKFKVGKKGLNITEGCMNIQVPPEYGNDSIKIGVLDGKDTHLHHSKFLGAQVKVDIDCGNKTSKDINVKVSAEKLFSQCKDRKAVYTALDNFVTSGKDLTNFRLDPFLEHLQKEGVVNAKEANDNKNHFDVNKRTKHLLELLLERPSAAEKVLVCLDKSGNDHLTKQIRQLIPAKSGNSTTEEKWSSLLVFRADDGDWNILDPKIAKKLQKELGCTLQTGNRRFEMVSLTVSSEKDVEDIADQLVNHERGTTVTLVCKHKTDDYQGETFLHVLPAKDAMKETRRLQEHGYTRGPMELAEFNIMDGEIVEFYMSGNIGLEYFGRRLSQGTVESFPFKANRDICKLNCNIYVVDKKSLDQMDDDRFRGLLHYRVRARGPLKERTDAVEVTWMKVSKRYLSHLSMNGDLQALGKFISSKLSDRKEMHKVFVTMDTADTVKEIEQRVERQCKNDTDVIRYETTLFIWANQNKDESDKKIEKILHAVRTYPWCNEARRFVTLYIKAGP